LNPDKKSDCYIATLTKLRARISRVRPEKKTTFLMQNDNARPHTSLKTVEHTVNLGQTVVPHPLYNPDLVPSDFHLFRPMKINCMGNIFLAMMPLYKLLNIGPPPLVQIFTSVACRLLFIAGESA
jgi:histone-lysine N-methyltransferase SETMAR